MNITGVYSGGVLVVILQGGKPGLVCPLLVLHSISCAIRPMKYSLTGVEGSDKSLDFGSKVGYFVGLSLGGPGF